MEFTLANYTLPAMCHVVCTLVATRISGVSVLNSVPPASQPPQLQQRPATLPAGYVEYPEVGFAYKVYDSNATWLEATAWCSQDEAQLALIDSAEKLEYVKRQKQSGDWAHVGIIRILDDQLWLAPNQGRPVNPLSLPWIDGAPSGDKDCVQIDFQKNGLGNYDCFYEANTVCEIPISQKSTTQAESSEAGPDEVDSAYV